MGDAVRIGIGGDAGELVGAVNESIKILNAFADKAEKIFGGFKQQVAKAFDWDAQVAKGGHVTQQAFGQLELLVKGMAGQVKVSTDGLAKFADQLSAVSKFSNEAAVDVERLFLAMGTLDEGGIKRATVAAADSAAKTGESFEKMATMIRDAMRDPIAQLDNLRAAGIAFTDAEIKSLQAMKEANNVAGMQAAILGKVEKAMDGAANHGASKFGDAMQKLGNAWEDVTQLIADSSKFWDAFAPLVEKVADTIRSALIPAVRVAIDVIASFQDVVKKAFVIGMELAVAGATKGFSAIEALVNNWSAAVDVAFQAVSGYATQVSTIFDHVFHNVLPQYVDWFKGNWESAIDELTRTTSTKIKSGGSSIAETVKGIATQAGAVIVPVISAALGLIPPLLDGILQSIPPIIEAGLSVIPPIAEAIFDRIPPIAKAVFDAIPPLLAAVFPSIEKTVAAAIVPIAQIMSSAVPPVLESMKIAFDTFCQYLIDLFKHTFKSIRYSIVEDMAATADQLSKLFPAFGIVGGGQAGHLAAILKGLAVGEGPKFDFGKLKGPDFGGMFGGAGGNGFNDPNETGNANGPGNRRSSPFPSPSLTPGASPFDDANDFGGGLLSVGDVLKKIADDFDAVAKKNQEAVDAALGKGLPVGGKDAAGAAVNAARGKGGTIPGGGSGGVADNMALGLESLTALNDRITAAAGIGSSTNPTVKAVNKAAEQQRADAAKAFQQRADAKKEAQKRHDEDMKVFRDLAKNINNVGGMVP